MASQSDTGGYIVGGIYALYGDIYARGSQVEPLCGLRLSGARGIFHLQEIDKNINSIKSFEMGNLNYDGTSYVQTTKSMCRAMRISIVCQVVMLAIMAFVFFFTYAQAKNGSIYNPKGINEYKSIVESLGTVATIVGIVNLVVFIVYLVNLYKWRSFFKGEDQQNVTFIFVGSLLISFIGLLRSPELVMIGWIAGFVLQFMAYKGLSTSESVSYGVRDGMAKLLKGQVMLLWMIGIGFVLILILQSGSISSLGALKTILIIALLVYAYFLSKYYRLIWAGWKDIDNSVKTV